MTKVQRILWDYGMMTVGTAITAIGINGFYVPAKISDGGISGVGIILLYLLHVPLWVSLTVLNVPLLWLSKKLWGNRVGTRTVYGTLMLSVMVGIIRIGAVTHNVLLATVYGGLLSGVGLGMVFRARGTTGGSDVIARLLTRFLPITMGQGMMVVDFFVIAAFGLVFNPTLAMYSLIALFISSRAIDVVQEGVSYARAFTIVSQKPDIIAAKVLEVMDRGVTRIGAYGEYTKEPREILYVVITRSEVSTLKELIYSVDSTAFVVVATVHEVVGEGFRKPPLEV
ncbi:YitT family protein [Sulfobacillus thermosulfidooxidans]|uniref:YitT family protein n=1 Tax=Sulfobacillus thermosulfidooxidans TaxID=28034 RepID=UPI00041DA91F|nr:YitT family protein [Sulfobacillus thermosulfidooxidans]